MLVRHRHISLTLIRGRFFTFLRLARTPVLPSKPPVSVSSDSHLSIIDLPFSPSANNDTSLPSPLLTGKIKKTTSLGFGLAIVTRIEVDPSFVLSSSSDDGSTNVESDPFDTRRFSALPPSRTYLATKTAMQIAAEVLVPSPG